MDITILIAALIAVESGGNAGAVGDNGKAIGALQIHPIFVDDVNRILGREVYRYDDRWQLDYSVEMVKIWLTYYKGRIYERKRLNDNATTMPMYLAISFNRGYSAMNQMKHYELISDPYWLKVSAELDRMTKISP